MEKVYKSRVYRVIFNFLCGAVLSIFIFFIAHIWLSSLTSIIIATVIFLSYVWLVIWGNFITIIVNDKELIVKNGKKEDRYEFSKYRFHAKTVSSRNDTECTLYAVDENGNQSTIDCELIGIGQFRQLINDLKLDVGVNKINTIKKDK
ncbi:magnesium transporter [Fusobacterium canifelinum]|uniref:Magnesium transporter n=1 Tax=Fusobacterium canifelinum TaxID=285729 RepID=A0ABX7CH22_9FUSO|nr:magnesium transporter [Fusobacterium canifelinum]QQS88426.1 magnesium transporter [Fusobacterium canifelinum]